MLESEKLLAEAQRDSSLQREKTHRVEEKNLVAAEQIKASRAHITRLEQEDQDLRTEQTRQEFLREQLQARLAELQMSQGRAEEDLRSGRPNSRKPQVASIPARANERSSTTE